MGVRTLTPRLIEPCTLHWMVKQVLDNLPFTFTCRLQAESQAKPFDLVWELAATGHSSLHLLCHETWRLSVKSVKDCFIAVLNGVYFRRTGKVHIVFRLKRFICTFAQLSEKWKDLTHPVQSALYLFFSIVFCFVYNSCVLLNILQFLCILLLLLLKTAK